VTRPDPTVRAAHRRRRGGYAAGAGVLLTGAVGYVGLVDPHDAGAVYPRCPFKWLTGWDCPFCGGLRMTHDLVHGHLLAAIADNAFLLVLLPLLTGLVVVRRRRGVAPLPAPAAIALAVAALTWTVLRNLPGFPLVPTMVSG
jgi:Protein of unknown function (DUF2752)